MANRVEITFNTDAVDGDKTFFIITEMGTPAIFLEGSAWWLDTPGTTDDREIETPTPTANAGEATAIDFMSHSLILDFISDGNISISRDVNKVTIDITKAGTKLRLGPGEYVGDTTYVYSTIGVGSSVSPNILGQELTDEATYCYLYEPLVATISSELTFNQKLFIDLELINTEDGTTYETLIDYGEFDMIEDKAIKIDLMEMARQYHDSKLYKIGLVSDISTAWEMVVSKYKYKFTLRFSELDEEYEIVKLPIIGGRNFQNFTPQVTQTTPLNEADKYNVDLTNKFIGYPIIETTLADPTLTDARPTITVTNQTSGCNVKKGVIWKSSLGGWMTWGFKLENKKYSHKYVGKLDVEIFEGTQDVGGHIYKPVDYTGVESAFSTSLKSLSLSSDELEAVSGINFTTAAYYTTSDGKMELMRVSGANTPLDSKANGGDFSLSLKSIGSVNQSTM